MQRNNHIEKIYNILRKDQIVLFYHNELIKIYRECLPEFVIKDNKLKIIYNDGLEKTVEEIQERLNIYMKDFYPELFKKKLE